MADSTKINQLQEKLLEECRDENKDKGVENIE